jgi:hypothetical protein
MMHPLSTDIFPKHLMVCMQAKYLAGQAVVRQEQAIFKGLRDSVSNFDHQQELALLLMPICSYAGQVPGCAGAAKQRQACVKGL